MPKFLRIAFILLSIVLVVAAVVACVGIINKDKSQTDDESTVSSPDGSDTEESSATVYESSEESAVIEESSVAFEESFEESSEDVSFEESSEDVSEEPPKEDVSGNDSSQPEIQGGQRDPIVTAPDGILADEIDSYYQNSLFVGHSVMVHFSNRLAAWRNGVSKDILSNALLCCSSSFSFYNNIHQTPDMADNVLPKYRGTPYNIEDLPAVTGRKTLYLSLMGLNDLGMIGKPDTCAKLVSEEAIQTIEAIKNKNPDVEIIVLATTYLTRDKSYSNLNNKNLSLLNSYVLEYCNANGIDFIDVASPLRDGDGYLADVYSSDSYCHLTAEAYYIWMDILRDYATKKTQGTWVNPTSIPLFE